MERKQPRNPLGRQARLAGAPRKDKPKERERSAPEKAKEVVEKATSAVKETAKKATGKKAQS